MPAAYFVVHATMKRLIADFNRDWPDVTRTRDTLLLAKEFGG
ncbi:MAG TPA: hypothetical protein VGL45_12705 [Bradyrhizobium sp.]|jgi:hypothetical protein